MHWEQIGDYIHVATDDAGQRRFELARINSSDLWSFDVYLEDATRYRVTDSISSVVEGKRLAEAILADLDRTKLLDHNSLHDHTNLCKYDAMDGIESDECGEDNEEHSDRAEWWDDHEEGATEDNIRWSIIRVTYRCSPILSQPVMHFALVSAARFDRAGYFRTRAEAKQAVEDWSTIRRSEAARERPALVTLAEEGNYFRAEYSDGSRCYFDSIRHPDPTTRRGCAERLALGRRGLQGDLRLP